MTEKKRVIKSDLARLNRSTDEQIDYSDIPELDEHVFAQPLVSWPPSKESITIRVDSDVLAWFRRQGRGYQTRINLVLRRYMDLAADPTQEERASARSAGRGRSGR
jgi:uncharacterized protein (DUF4415 family)